MDCKQPMDEPVFRPVFKPKAKSWSLAAIKSVLLGVLVALTLTVAHLESLSFGSKGLLALINIFFLPGLGLLWILWGMKKGRLITVFSGGVLLVV